MLDICLPLKRYPKVRQVAQNYLISLKQKMVEKRGIQLTYKTYLQSVYGIRSSLPKWYLRTLGSFPEEVVLLTMIFANEPY